MNERIEKLAEQCGFRSNPNIYDRNQSFDIEKFAELLVRECIEISQVGSITESKLKQHFGINN